MEKDLRIGAFRTSTRTGAAQNVGADPRFVSATSRPPGVPNRTKWGTTGRLESDSHADTTVAGANMLCLAVTDQKCDVMPFNDSYSPIKSVPIVTAATAFDDPRSGETVILVVNQCLWFGTKMDHSLLCPNQVLSFGVQLCDDPYDPHREIGIVDPGSRLEVPFDVNNSMVGVLTRVPSHEEVQECRNIVLTDDAPWDPRSGDLRHNQIGLKGKPRRVVQEVKMSRNEVVVDDSLDDHMFDCSPALSSELLPRMVAVICQGA